MLHQSDVMLHLHPIILRLPLILPLGVPPALISGEEESEESLPLIIKSRLERGVLRHVDAPPSVPNTIDLKTC